MSRISRRKRKRIVSKLLYAFCLIGFSFLVVMCFFTAYLFISTPPASFLSRLVCFVGLAASLPYSIFTWWAIFTERF